MAGGPRLTGDGVRLPRVGCANIASRLPIPDTAFEHRRGRTRRRRHGHLATRRRVKPGHTGRGHHQPRDGGYLGALSIPGTGREAVLYRDAVAHAQAATPQRPSIVNGQIAAATRGAFGDVQFTLRTRGTKLFVNPLMAIYFTVDLDKLARRCLYLDHIENTIGRRQVIGRIEKFRDGISTRIPRAFPH